MISSFDFAHNSFGKVFSPDAAWARCLELAEKAATLDEVPVGAVVLDPEGRLAGQGIDWKMQAHDPTAHAEVMAMRQAAAAQGDWRLDGYSLFVTLEPCAMCAGAILLARIGRLHYAAESPKFGAVESQARLFEAGAWNHRPEVLRAPEDVAAKSRELLQAYFRHKRKGR